MNLTHVFDCFEYFLKKYHPECMLNEEEFDDTFSSLLNSCSDYFALLEVGERIC